jgi:hypothetical protein
LPPAVVAWYTFASLPVEMQPLMALNTPWLSILKSTSRVRGSSACSTVARSAFSVTRTRPADSRREFSRTDVATVLGSSAMSPKSRASR